MEFIATQIATAIGIVFAIWKTSKKNERAIEELSRKQDEHMIFDIKDKIKYTYHNLRRLEKNNEPIHPLEIDHAIELVTLAKKHNINSETTPMQKYIEGLYKKLLRGELNHEKAY